MSTKWTPDDRSKKAFDIATEAVKQVITLSTGVLALTITFSKDLLPSTTSHDTKLILVAAWVFYLLAIVSGVATLQLITGEISTEDSPSVGRFAVRFPAIAMIVFFWFGIVFSLVYGYQAYVK